MSTQCNHPNDVSLIEYYNVINKRRKGIIAFVAFSVAIAIIYSLLLPKYYKAEAVIMPIGKGGGGGGLSALMGQFGGLASLAGIGGAVGGQTQNQQFMALLKTRTLAEDVAKKNNLMPIFLKNYDPAKPDAKAVEKVAATLQGAVKFTEDKKNGTIVISAELKNPKLAADIANYYVDGLNDFINKNSFTVAKRNRVFIEEQLAQNKRDLLEAGKALNGFYKGERVSNVESQVDVPIGVAVQGDLEALNKQKQDIDAKLMVENVPQQVYLQYLTLKRSISTQINSLLTQQYEMAKIEEKKDELAFQVIDPARTPTVRSKPQRSKIVMLTFIGTLIFGVFASFIMEFVHEIKGKL